MARAPRILDTVSRLRAATARFRAAGERIALVPTMGALHAGHLSLVKAAQRKADRIVVSIFVNPTQFAPSEDFSSYPRTFEKDVAALRVCGVDAIWAPTAKTMYPAGFATRIMPEGPASAGLEDAFRPHFFGGVATVVAKLFLQVAPDFAIFGEKDFQQLKVVTHMARDLDIPVTVVGVATQREKDGLALSSRNAYLSPAERQIAPVLHRVLKDCAAKIKSGAPLARTLGKGRKTIAQAGFVLDYLEARDAESLAPIKTAAHPRIRLLVAARLGKTRLIDNLGV